MHYVANTLKIQPQQIFISSIVNSLFKDQNQTNTNKIRNYKIQNIRSKHSATWCVTLSILKSKPFNPQQKKNMSHVTYNKDVIYYYINTIYISIMYWRFFCKAGKSNTNWTKQKHKCKVWLWNRSITKKEFVELFM